MTLLDFINYLAIAEEYPKEVEFEGLKYQLEGDNEKSVWMQYKHTESDGCWEFLSMYCATPYYLKQKIKFKVAKNWYLREGVWVHKDGRTKHPLYPVWWGMINRCHSPNAGNYYLYGARGITVCSRWRGANGFNHFIEDMGERPEGYTLDRIDVNGDYSPANCRWASLYEQQANRRVKNKTTGMVGVFQNKNSKTYYAEIGGKKNRIRKSFKTLKEAAAWREAELKKNSLEERKVGK